jgi:hypothetical protein
MAGEPRLADDGASQEAGAAGLPVGGIDLPAGQTPAAVFGQRADDGQVEHRPRQP